MDDFSTLLNLHNSFGFSQNTISQGLNPSNKTCHSADVITTDISTLMPGETVPDFISDDGTPNSSLSSLITPTEPLSGQFTFPPSSTYQTPFPSEDSFPSHPDSAYMSFAHPNTAPPPYVPTWGAVPQAITTQHTGLADHSTLALAMPHDAANYGVLAPTLPHDAGMFLCRLADPPLVESKCDKHSMSTAKHAVTTGPKRVKKSCKRQTPYGVDKDHEGATKSNFMSQQAILSETPGYGYGNATKCSTKSRNRKKSHRSPAAANQPVAGPSAGVDRCEVANSGIRVPRRTHRAKMAPPTTSAETGMVTPPEVKTISAIRRHARSKRQDPSKVTCAFVNASCEDYGG